VALPNLCLWALSVIISPDKGVSQLAGTFELLAYTDADLEAPLEWEESTARLIPNASNVQMRSWATGVSTYSILRWLALVYFSLFRSSKRFATASTPSYLPRWLE
jgi:hypothetical protein